MRWKKNNPKDVTLKPGMTFEKYIIVKQLGQGGMGSVYLVRHNVLDSLFALKILASEVASKNKQFVDRFIREAKLACKIRHPNLITVHDAGKDPKNGLYFIVMDYVSGGSVRDLLNKEQRIPPDRALKIITQIADALTAAYANHMVHRDIKPDNIMFAADGSAKLADLGIAKSSDEQDTMLTMAASVFGTPAYMSPEQANDSSTVDSRADIYSLGIVFFEMLSGVRPYYGNSAVQILSQIVNMSNTPDIRRICPDTPPDLADLISRMMEKNIEKRIQNPDILFQELNRIHIPAEFAGKKLRTQAEIASASMPDVTMPTMEVGKAPSPAPAPVVPDVTMPTMVQTEQSVSPARQDQTAAWERSVSSPEVSPTETAVPRETTASFDSSKQKNITRIILLASVALFVLVLIAGAVILLPQYFANKSDPAPDRPKAISQIQTQPESGSPSETKTNVTAQPESGSAPGNITTGPQTAVGNVPASGNSEPAETKTAIGDVPAPGNEIRIPPVSEDRKLPEAGSAKNPIVLLADSSDLSGKAQDILIGAFGPEKVFSQLFSFGSYAKQADTIIRMKPSIVIVSIAEMYGNMLKCEDNIKALHDKFYREGINLIVIQPTEEEDDDSSPLMKVRKKCNEIGATVINVNDPSDEQSFVSSDEGKSFIDSVSGEMKHYERE